jgi:hypothetical protein
MRQSGKAQQQSAEADTQNKSKAAACLIRGTIVVRRFGTNGAIAHGVSPEN